MKWIDEERLLKRLTDPPAGAGEGHGVSHKVAKKLRDWLRRQPNAPHLVSRQVAAEILGILPPHITRYVDQGRMPDPIEVDGGFPVYVREEVEALAKELRKERADRARKKKAREKKERQKEEAAR